jgi:hypothetical protein
MPNKRVADCGNDSPASVCEFQGYEAGDCNGEIELPDDSLQIGQAASKWIDRNDDQTIPCQVLYKRFGDFYFKLSILSRPYEPAA